MSHRTIDENTRYFIFNEGVDLNLPVLNLIQDPSQKNTTIVTAGGNWTFNGNPPVIGAQTLGYWPRVVAYGVALNYPGASALVDVDWTAKFTAFDTFPTLPSPGTAASFVFPIVLTPTQYSIPAGGLWDIEVQWTFGANLTATNQAIIQLQESFNNGGVFGIAAQVSVNVPAAGIPVNTMSLTHKGFYSGGSVARVKVTVASTLAFAASAVAIKFTKTNS